MDPDTTAAVVFASMEWAILPSKLAEIKLMMERHFAGERLSSDEAARAVEDSSFRSDPSRRLRSDDPSVQVVRVTDTLTNRASGMAASSGATSYSSIAAQVRRGADDDSVSVTVLDVDSPGGTVNGVDQACQAIQYSIEKGTPVIACVNDHACSAALWIVSQCSEVVVSSTSMLGSIGVLSSHTDTSKLQEKLGITTTLLAVGEFKDLGDPNRPLSAEHKAKILARMQGTRDLFVRAVANGRGLPLDANVLKTADTYQGQEAIDAGLADRIGSFHDVLTAFSTSSTSDMNPDQLALLGLQADATPQQITDRLTQLASAQTPAPAAVVPTPAAVASAQPADLGAQLAQLTTVVASLVTGQVTAKQQQDADRAKALINPLVQSGAVSPADATSLIADATTNYDLVASIVSKALPGAKVPVGGVNLGTELGRQAHLATDGNVQAHVFDLMGMMGPDGKVQLQNVTLPLTGHGEVSYDAKEATYPSNRVDTSVAAALTGTWL